DLILLNVSEDGYRQDLRDALIREAEHGVNRFGAPAAGIHILNFDQLNEEDRILLLAAARLVLNAGGPSLGAQLRLPAAEEPLPEPLVPAAPRNRFDSPSPREAVTDLQPFNGWGGFTRDGTEYRLIMRTGHPLPAPWINVMANP